MLNDDVIAYIKTFLIKCNQCDKYNCALAYNKRICCYCRKYVCDQCVMIADYTEYQVRMLYCMNCHQSLFSS